MFIYEYLLKFYGLRSLISNGGNIDNIAKQSKQIKVTVDDDFEINNKVIHNKNYCYKCIKIPINLVYWLFILIIINWKFIYVITMAILKMDYKYLTANIMSVLPVAQFITGIIYYQSKHFPKMMKRNKKYSIYILTFLIIAVILSFMISILSLILLILDFNILTYSEIWNNINIFCKFLLLFAMFLDNFYSYGIIFTNFVIFTSVFILHSLEINQYVHKVKDFIKNNEDGLTLDSIIKEHAEKKTYHTKSVKKMNSIFSSIVFFGIIGSYFLLLYWNTKFADTMQIIDILIFAILGLIYIYSISKVKTNVGKIIKLVSSEIIMTKYLSRIDVETLNNEWMPHDFKIIQNVKTNKSNANVKTNKSNVKRNNSDVNVKTNKSNINVETDKSNKLNANVETDKTNKLNANVEIDKSNVETDKTNKSNGNVETDKSNVETNKSDVNNETNKTDVNNETNKTDVNNETNKTDANNETNKLDVNNEIINNELDIKIENIININADETVINMDYDKTESDNMMEYMKELKLQNNTFKQIEDYVNYTKSLNFRTMLRTYESSDGIQWLILNETLGKGWKNFEIFGFVIDNAALLQKIIAIIISFLMVFNYDKLFAFV